VAFSFDALCSMHEKFEANRIKKAKAIVGDRPMRPDHLIKFVVERTHLCPHKLLTPLTAYWLETVNILDGEMGLSLPAPIAEVPALFFDALAIVRDARAQVTRDDKKE
jgi:hypothetical protein